MEGRWKEDGRKMEDGRKNTTTDSCFLFSSLCVLCCLCCLCLCFAFAFSFVSFVHLPGATSSFSSSSSSSRSRAPANKGKNSREARRNQRAQKNAELDTIGKATRVRYYIVEYTNLELPSNFSSLELLLPRTSPPPTEHKEAVTCHKVLVNGISDRVLADAAFSIKGTAVVLCLTFV